MTNSDLLRGRLSDIEIHLDVLDDIGQRDSGAYLRLRQEREDIRQELAAIHSAKMCLGYADGQ